MIHCGLYDLHWQNSEERTNVPSSQLILWLLRSWLDLLYAFQRLLGESLKVSFHRKMCVTPPRHLQGVPQLNQNVTSFHTTDNWIKDCCQPVRVFLWQLRNGSRFWILVVHILFLLELCVSVQINSLGLFATYWVLNSLLGISQTFLPILRKELQRTGVICTIAQATRGRTGTAPGLCASGTQADSPACMPRPARGQRRTGAADGVGAVFWWVSF